MVVYARPKPEKDVDIGVPHHLGYFLSAMLKRKSKPLVATLESWCPGSGLPVMLAGHNILTLISDLKPHQFYEVINIYLDHTSNKICLQGLPIVSCQSRFCIKQFCCSGRSVSIAHFTSEWRCSFHDYSHNISSLLKQQVGRRTEKSKELWGFKDSQFREGQAKRVQEKD